MGVCQMGIIPCVGHEFSLGDDILQSFGRHAHSQTSAAFESGTGY